MTIDKDQILPIVPEPEYDDPKELYAFFGLAVYSAQLLEQGIINLMVGLHISGMEAPTWADVCSLYEQGDRKTLGQILKAARKIVPFDPTIELQLERALGKRNFLVHHFFVENDENLLTESGKRKMIDELSETISFFKKVDLQVDELWHAVWTKYGFTKERIERDLRVLKEKLQKQEQDT